MAALASAAEAGVVYGTLISVRRIAALIIRKLAALHGSVPVGWDRGADRASNDADVSSIPLRFRTAGSLQYGSKAGISDGTFPEHPSA